MSARLVAEVLHHAPADLTPLERLLLVVIAEAAQDHDRRGDSGREWKARECAPGLEALAQRCGVQPDSARRAIQRLAGRGLEVRVPLGPKSKTGQPVYAFQGHATTFRLPVLPCPAGGTTGVAPSCCKAGRQSHQEPGSQSHLADERRDAGPREVGLSSAEGGTTVPPKQKEPEEPPPHPPYGREPSELAAWLVDTDGVTIDEARAIIAAAEADPATHTSARSRLKSSPEYRARLLHEVRKAHSSRSAAARQCRHGVVDGYRVTGSGEHASRICVDCETSAPASELDLAEGVAV